MHIGHLILPSVYWYFSTIRRAVLLVTMYVSAPNVCESGTPRQKIAAARTFRFSFRFIVSSEPVIAIASEST